LLAFVVVAAAAAAAIRVGWLTGHHKLCHTALNGLKAQLTGHLHLAEVVKVAKVAIALEPTPCVGAVGWTSLASVPNPSSS
jgi:hypothetical protein